MSSTEEFEQQNTWKEELKKSFHDELILGESYTHISKDSVKRIDPLSPEGQVLYNIIQQKLEEDLINHIDPNKSYLPKDITDEK